MSATDQAGNATRFLELHASAKPLLLLPNAWDAGSARVLESLGFEAIATTSSGYAATLGRLDYGVSREEALAHCEALVAASELPVSADLENGFGDDPDAVGETVRGALAAGLAGCSIEDSTGRSEEPIYEHAASAARVAAAADAAHGGARRLVLTARAENYLHGRPDLEDTIARLQSYQEAGADVLYAPGLSSAEEIRAVVTSVERPVNVLARAGLPSIAQLAELGVRRVSVGGAFAFAALDALVRAAHELRDEGTYGFAEQAAAGARAARAAFAPGQRG